jgi:transcriptional regulator with XRE-family HTH domain
MTIGESIKSLRRSAGLLQRELADDVGISAAMLSLVESGKREPTITLLRNISTALDIPAGVLFAIALEDKSVRPNDPIMRKLHDLTDHLLRAAAHSIKASRARRDREALNP